MSEKMPPYKYGVRKLEPKIDRITYDRKVNLGNYETQNLSASAQIDENEDPVEAFKQLKDFVHQQLGIAKVDKVDNSDLDAPF